MPAHRRTGAEGRIKRRWWRPEHYRPHLTRADIERQSREALAAAEEANEAVRPTRAPTVGPLEPEHAAAAQVCS